MTDTDSPEPGAFATAPIDVLLRNWQQAPADSTRETPEGYYARKLLARAVARGRAEGMNTAALVVALARSLEKIAATLPPPLSPAQLERLLAPALPSPSDPEDPVYPV
ncbi:hypothetical protein SEA_GARDENSTATE_75 [Microbacterium phage GardenState]|uniref:Uncharacterized protein n=2 Tax=Gardenstatevirus TaxID=3425012 RepID=A0A4Y6E749_9CAUD|nr:hypothetical protein SEA_IAMGROOT_74 [Microbacterium phage IAmGroot]QOI66987.1 hypothetical protein SEA_GARDENSTATE_75 [Microbacterium phage GardenState]